jgi:hypothetical protein
MEPWSLPKARPISSNARLPSSGAILTHHGLMSRGFVTPFLYMIRMASGRTSKLWRSELMDAMRALLFTPRFMMELLSVTSRRNICTVGKSIIHAKSVTVEWKIRVGRVVVGGE